MAQSQFQMINKKTWNKYSFYINILVFVIIGLMIYMIILDTYQAGILARSGAGDSVSKAWIYVVRDVAFLAVALTWVFFQLFRNQWIILKRSY